MEEMREVKHKVIDNVTYILSIGDERYAVEREEPNGEVWWKYYSSLKEAKEDFDKLTGRRV